MTYQGGKQKFLKIIIPYINQYIKDHNIENFYDMCCGGFNIGSNVKCENIFANDLSPTLIALLKQAQEDLSKICKNETREQWYRCYSEYKRIRNNNFEGSEIPLSEIGACEWLCSYSGGGFPRGYGVYSRGRNQFEERYRNLEKQSKLEGFKKAIFTCGDYKDVEILPNSLLYFDCPYKGTASYGINPHFNYVEYYDFLMETSKKFPIFISEQSIPDDIPAQIIWKKEVNRDIGKGYKASETLYFLDRREKE